MYQIKISKNSGTYQKSYGCSTHHITHIFNFYQNWHSWIYVCFFLLFISYKLLSIIKLREQKLYPESALMIGIFINLSDRFQLAISLIIGWAYVFSPQLHIIFMKKTLIWVQKLLKLLNKKKFRINLSWLLFDKLFRASANIFLTVFLARHLGPDNFGVLNYLLAILFLFVSISSLGVNPVLINEILKKKEAACHL